MKNTAIFPRRFIFLAAVIYSQQSSARAQIATDGSLGVRRALQGPNYNISADLGRLYGKNLFHSFTKFNLSWGESANFSGPGGVKNIISRVTGGQPSRIDGSINSSIPQANLFFLNPSGVVFGAHGSVNVGGSFVASTADYLKLQDGTLFRTGGNPAGLNAPLSDSTPRTFGFLSPNPTGISIVGTTLKAAPGKSLTLVGGDINLSQAQLKTQNGQINLVSVHSSGETGGNSAFTPSAAGFASGGNTTLLSGTNLEATGQSSNGISIQSGDLTMDHSHLSVAGNSYANQGGVQLQIKGKALLTRSTIVTDSASSKFGGNIRIQAGELSLEKASNLTAQGSSVGRGGDIFIQADKISLIEDSSAAAIPGPSFPPIQFVDGDSGSIHLKAKDILLSGTGKTEIAVVKVVLGTQSKQANGILLDASNIRIENRARVDLSNSIDSPMGDITLNSENIVIDGMSGDGFNGTGVSLGRTGGGPKGNIYFNSRNILMRRGGSVFMVVEHGNVPSQGTVRFKGTNVTLESGALIAMRTIGTPVGSGEQILVTKKSLSSGLSPEINTTGGLVQILAKKISFLGGGNISAFVLGDLGGCVVKFDADDIIFDGPSTGINADPPEANDNSSPASVFLHSKTLQILNGATIDLTNFSNSIGGVVDITSDDILLDGRDFSGCGIFTDTFGEIASGSAGQIRIRAKRLDVLAGASISSSTLGAGNGGDIIIVSNDLGVDTGSTITASTIATGQGGTIDITAHKTLAVSNGSSIIATSDDQGAGGSINVRARNLALTHNGSIAVSATGIGDAGQVNIMTDEGLNLIHGSHITSSARSSNGGEIKISAGTDIGMDHSSIDTFAAGNGGTIKLVAGRQMFFKRSQLNATAGGVGGNIELTGDSLVLNRAQLKADAKVGNGGNITLTGRTLVPSADSILSATSQLGVAGLIQLNAPSSNLAEALAALPGTPISAEDYLLARCLVRHDNGSSFTIHRFQFVLPQPSAPLPSTGSF